MINVTLSGHIKKAINIWGFRVPCKSLVKPSQQESLHL